MIDEENKSQHAAEAAGISAPAHAAASNTTPVEPEDTVFSLPLSHVTSADTEDDPHTPTPAPAHFAEPEPEPALDPETAAVDAAPSAPAHFADPAAEAIAQTAAESAAILDAPAPQAPSFAGAVTASEPAPAYAPTHTPVPAPVSTPAPEPAHFAEPEPEPATAPAAEVAPSTEPAPAHAATPEPQPLSDDRQTQPLDEADAPAVAPESAPAEPAAEPQPAPAHAAATPAAETDATAPAETEDASPEDTADLSEAVEKTGDTAEIDVQAVEAKLKDPGSTQSFEPVKDAERIETDSTYDAGTTTSLMWGARSDVGCVRPHNEDSYLVQSPLFCVCDGMGGHAAGEVASSIAVETIAKTAPPAADPARLAAAVEAANAAVIEAAMNGLGKPGMGCTATCAYIENDTLAIAHVGDSRAYLLHDGTLIRVTRDHSYVEELVDAGEITADEARVHPNRSVITRALGSDPAMYADHFQLNIEEGDRLILCSDGLSSMVPDSDIENIATQSSTAQICVDNLVDAALAAGGHDNVTVIVVDLVDDGRVRAAKKRHRRNAIIGIVAAVVLAAVAAIWAYTSVTGSVYLGAHKGCVAIYRGLPGKTLGFDLHWLEDETTVKLSDLPEDTQNRLKQGIQQGSVDDAQDTVSKYRHQIDEEQTKQVIDAETIRQNTSKDSTADEDAAKSAEEESSKTDSDSDSSSNSDSEGSAAHE